MDMGRYLKFLLLGVLLFSSTIVGAQEYNDFNRPIPLMDYVPQEIGIYDTIYDELTAEDCRGCHGNALAPRHHATDTVVKDGLCTPCHWVTSDGSDIANRSCVAEGCHSRLDLETNGWHHNTDLSIVGVCVACHDPNLIAPISPIQDFTSYPPSVITPTPFSCENCHWEQGRTISWDPEAPGHPSTYDRYDNNGNYIGYQEYSKPIYRSGDTHHMGYAENSMVSACYKCHSVDPISASWDPANPELIRYCQTCHDVSSLHSIEPHVTGVSGWKALGFHADSVAEEDVDPVEYRTSSGDAVYSPQVSPRFDSSDMCMGCHGDVIASQVPEPLDVPVIEEIQPTFGVCGAIVGLFGGDFGDEPFSDSRVEVRKASGKWEALPIYAWTATRIDFQVPCWELAPGNYRIRVRTSGGVSNQVNFTVENVSVGGASPRFGQCGTAVTIEGIGFGNSQTEMLDDYYGVHHVVDFSASQGDYTAVDYSNWSDTRFTVHFDDFYVDGASIDTGSRNYMRDPGEEPLIQGCNYMGAGIWSLHPKTVYFGDNDGNGGLTADDTIFQVVTSNSDEFELVRQPEIYILNPDTLDNQSILKVFGQNFGPLKRDAEVRIGSKLEAQSATLGQGTVIGAVEEWHNTLIYVHVDVPKALENKTWFVWVEKAGMKSNYKSLRVSGPIILHTVEIETKGEGSVVPSGGTYAEGMVLELQAQPEEEWLFSHWTNGYQATEENPYSLEVTQDRKIMAVFVEAPVVEYTLETSIEGGGSIIANPDGATHSDGTLVELLAVPASGYAFSHWTNGYQKTRENPYELAMTQNRKIRAVFYEETSESASSTDPSEENGDSLPSTNPEEPKDEEVASDANSDKRDGNKDGIPDALQDHVVSLKTSDGKYIVTIESERGSILRECVALDKPLDAQDVPSDGEYPYGFFSFVVDGVEIGGETWVAIHLPKDAAPAEYYKYGPEPNDMDPHWYEFVYDDVERTGAEIDGNRIVLHFVDGERGDDDLEANGSIVDDGGPKSEERESAGGSGGGGCFVGTLTLGF